MNRLLPRLPLLLICAALGGAAALADDARLDADRRTIDATFAQELETLAKKCDELKLPEQAAIARKWPVARRYQVQYHFLPDFFARDIREKRSPAAPPATAPEIEQQWWKRFLLVRSQQADRLFELAKKRLGEKRSQEAFALLHEALRENPDHAEARRILGYTGKPGKWAPQERTPKYSRVSKTETTFNWAPNRHGVVDSAHFRIRTNADSKEALAAANYLEECHDVWRIVFAGFWLTPEELQKRFDGPFESPKASKERLEVVLFATREEYVAQLEPYEKNIAASRGYYAPGRKTSFFYLDSKSADASENVRANWAHEMSHQLFSAYSRNPAGLARAANFWVIEGAAMYMESLALHDGYATTGGFEAERVQDARQRLKNLREHASLRELLPLGQEAFQKDPRIRQFYTAGAGYTHFLLDGNAARHRDAFLSYLRKIYDEQDAADLLLKELGTAAGSLEADYAAFLDVSDEDLLALNDEKVTRLILGRTSVTRQGLAAIARFAQLKKLDLTDLAIDDPALSFLSPECDLEELCLFGVAIGDECEARLVKMRSLKELELSGTKVSPDCIERIKKALPQLTITH